MSAAVVLIQLTVNDTVTQSLFVNSGCSDMTRIFFRLRETKLSDSSKEVRNTKFGSKAQCTTNNYYGLLPVIKMHVVVH